MKLEVNIMNTKQRILASLLIGLLSLSISARADDIDIYSSPTSSNLPNVLIILDNAANFSASAGTCSYTDSATAPTLNNTTGGIEQCALNNVLTALGTNTDGTAKVNVGIMIYNASGLNTLYGCNSSGTGGCLMVPLTPMNATGKAAILANIKSWSTSGSTSMKSNNEASASTMQEAWAYYAGQTGMSGTSYASSAAAGCQKNFVIFIGNAYNTSGSPGDASAYPGTGASPVPSLATTIANNTALTAAQKTKFSSIITIPTGQYGIGSAYCKSGSSTTYTMGTHNDGSGLYMDEWSRYMYGTDLSTGASPANKNITTYGIGVLNLTTSPICTPDWAALLTSAAVNGGGKYFAAQSYNDVVQALLKILNEVQAVNSVFSSASLPVSVNTQGTYLNQIYMGMFRPDGSGNPRWVGNLKQYQFGLDPNTQTLFLADATGSAAINSSTGFITSNAASYWTCTNTPANTNNPVVQSSNVLYNVLLASLATCPNNTDPLAGFWASNPTYVANSGGTAWDLVDGEVVEKGGAAQSLRGPLMTADYTAAVSTSTTPTSNTRRLYTFCPQDPDNTSGTCTLDLTNSANQLSVANTGITANLFGSTGVTLNVTSLNRTGLSVAGTTSSANGFLAGDTVTISGATPTDYNGSFTLTSASGSNFAYNIAAEYPPAPAAGSYVASGTVPGEAISKITRTAAAGSGNSDTANVTVAANILTNPNAITISGAGGGYDGSYTVLASPASTATTFSYTVPVYPPATATTQFKVSINSASASVSGSASVAKASYTVTVTASNTFLVGDYICVTGSTLSGVNVCTTITSATTGQFVYTGTYHCTGGSACAGGTVTVTLSAAPQTITPKRIETAIGIATAAAALPASQFVNGDKVDITAVSGSATAAAFESNYAVGGVTATIYTTSSAASIAAGCTTYPCLTYPITTTPNGNVTAGTAALSSAATYAISSLTRSYPGGTTATATLASGTFNTGDAVTILPATTTPSNETAYPGNWTVTCVGASPCSQFTYGPLNLTPVTPASGSITIYDAAATIDTTALLRWIRGMDNMGDEQSLCPGAALNAVTGANYTNCPATPVTTRPSIHGDVLHSRPITVNYGGQSLAVTSTSDSGSTRTAFASIADVAKIGVIGTMEYLNFATATQNFSCQVKVATTTSFTYSSTNCGSTGAQTVVTGSDVVVYYGSNDGIYHAINGNQAGYIGTTPPGGELWGFAPADFFTKYNRQRQNLPMLLLPSTPSGISPSPQKKDYFADGPTGNYQLINIDNSTAKANIYIAMRRGGRFIYAMDVTNPSTPKFLWKKTFGSTDMTELGQTWSLPKVANVDGYANPVLIFGGGYDDGAEDTDGPPPADTQGRGIFILDAFTGALVWRATPTVTTPSCTTTQCKLLVSGMNYSIPSDITLMDRDSNGKIDRLYATDVGGNVWRVDLAPPKNNLNGTLCDTTSATGSLSCTPDIWQVTKLAALGCSSGTCAAGTTPRKFFFPAEVIAAVQGYNYDAVVVGSGDREHPLIKNDSYNVVNRFYMLKDTATGMDGSGLATLTEAGLYDCTTACTTATPYAGQLSGYYYTLGTGEKAVNAPLATAGYVYAGTNQPTAVSNTQCTTNLGIARGYRFSPFAGTFQSVTFSGGGLPPSPVSGVVDIMVNGVLKEVPFLIGGGNPDCTSGVDCSSALGGQKPTINVPVTRKRTYWYLQGK